MADRYNLQKQRLAKLQKLAKMPNSTITSKQHREMQILRSTASMMEQEYDLKTTLFLIAHIEDLASTNSATSSDLARLMVLKEKILGDE